MGRPREFDEDKVLDALLNVFWEKGYEGTSYADIVKATGLQKGSLYAAYGDKRSLYQQALARYDTQEVAGAVKMLSDISVPAARRIQALLQAPVDAAGSKKGRWGCLLCNAAVEQVPVDKQAEKSVRAGMDRLCAAIDAALKELPAYKRAPKLRAGKARALLAGYFGLRILVKAGMTKETVEAAAHDFMKV